MDSWEKDLGKAVTLIRQTDGQGGGIECYAEFSESVTKTRQLSGKIIGTDASGEGALIMLDKPITGRCSGSSFSYGGLFDGSGVIGHVAREYREEVRAARGQNRFIWVLESHRHAIKVEDRIVPPLTSSIEPEKKMSFFEMAKEDATDAAFRVAANKIAEGVKNLICLAITAKLENSSHGATVAAFLDTPIGVSIVQSTAGYALTYAPKKISDDPRVKRLAKEFRVAGMAGLGGLAVDQLMEHVVPLVENALSMLPEEESSKLRVHDEEETNNVVSLHSSEEKEAVEQKRMAAGR